MSKGEYSPDKAFAWPDRLKELKEGRQPYPVHLHLIISDLCNQNCCGCAYRMEGYSSNQLFGEVRTDGTINNNPSRFLDTELVKSVLNDCVEMGTRAVEFTGGGEPLVHKDAPMLLGYAQDLGLDTALITNGILLPKVTKSSVRTTWLRVSIDAATEATYGIVRPTLGQKNVFKKVCDNLENAVITRDLLGTDCTIGAGFVVHQQNYKEIYDFVKLAYNLGVDNVRISGLFSPQGDLYHQAHRDEAMALEQQAIADFDGKDGFKVHGRFNEKLADLAKSPNFKKCWYQEMTTYIGGDSKLYRCCVTSYNQQGYIGDLRVHGGFKSLWDSQQKQDKFSGFDARTCTFCQFTDRINSIDKALQQDELPTAPDDLKHKSFV